MKTFKAAVAYFGLVFGAGFALGTLRVLWAVPRFGERAAELAEMPLMLLATVLAARWTVRRFRLAGRPGDSLSVGLGALGLLLAAELAMVVLVSGQSLSQYVGAATRCPALSTSRCWSSSGSCPGFSQAYLAVSHLSLFTAIVALMPRLLAPRNP